MSIYIPKCRHSKDITTEDWFTQCYDTTTDSIIPNKVIIAGQYIQKPPGTELTIQRIRWCEDCAFCPLNKLTKLGYPYPFKFFVKSCTANKEAIVHAIIESGTQFLQLNITNVFIRISTKDFGEILVGCFKNNIGYIKSDGLYLCVIEQEPKGKATVITDDDKNYYYEWELSGSINREIGFSEFSVWNYNDLVEAGLVFIVPHYSHIEVKELCFNSEEQEISGITEVAGTELTIDGIADPVKGYFANETNKEFKKNEQGTFKRFSFSKINKNETNTLVTGVLGLEYHPIYGIPDSYFHEASFDVPAYGDESACENAGYIWTDSNCCSSIIPKIGKAELLSLIKGEIDLSQIPERISADGKWVKVDDSRINYYNVGFYMVSLLNLDSENPPTKEEQVMFIDYLTKKEVDNVPREWAIQAINKLPVITPTPTPTPTPTLTGTPSPTPSPTPGIKAYLECLFPRIFTGDLTPRITTGDPIPRITCLQKLR